MIDKGIADRVENLRVRIVERETGRTHWVGCEEVHIHCQTLDVMQGLLEHIESCEMAMEHLTQEGHRWVGEDAS